MGVERGDAVDTVGVSIVKSLRGEAGWSSLVSEAGDGQPIIWMASSSASENCNRASGP